MFQDSVVIETPEGIQLTVTPAGIGSRFLAAFADTFLYGLFILFLTVVLAAANSSLHFSGLLFVVAVGGYVLGYLAYFVLFESIGNGRTPGKRSAGIRVIKDTGESVDPLSSAIRNIVRIVDFLPVMYALGIITMFVSTRSQRLGDYAGGTLVVHDDSPRKLSRRDRKRADANKYVARFTPSDVIGWDVSGINNEELSIVRSYLERRKELLPSARADLAQRLAERLRPKVRAPGIETIQPDELLEMIDVAKAAQL